MATAIAAQTHTITVLVDNRPGVLARVSGLFARRGYNIESLTVSITDNPNMSRMTIVVAGDADTLEQITKQLNKLVDVIRLIDLNEGAAIERELMLIKVRAIGAEQRAELQRLADIYGGRIVDVTESSYIIEMTGDAAKLDAFIETISAKRVLEVVRSGALGILRGTKALRA
jgi:acetolactate synthase-1/3 small subunit